MNTPMPAEEKFLLSWHCSNELSLKKTSELIILSGPQHLGYWYNSNVDMYGKVHGITAKAKSIVYLKMTQIRILTVIFSQSNRPPCAIQHG